MALRDGAKVVYTSPLKVRLAPDEGYKRLRTVICGC